MALHPIMSVPDEYAERAFYELFGFERVNEGDEFPGFLAIGRGSAVIGLQKGVGPTSPRTPVAFAGRSRSTERLSWTTSSPSAGAMGWSMT